eukprot:g3733.t1
MVQRLALVVGQLLISACAGVFEDQAGLFDWQQQHIGRVDRALFQGKRAYVATGSDVVAALNVRTGATEWRHVLPKGDAVDRLVYVAKASADGRAGKVVLVLSGGGRRVRALRAKDGALVWDAQNHYGPDEAPAGAVDAAVAGPGLIATLARNRVVVRRADTGQRVWALDDAAARAWAHAKMEGVDGVVLQQFAPADGRDDALEAPLRLVGHARDAGESGAKGVVAVALELAQASGALLDASVARGATAAAAAAAGASAWLWRDGEGRHALLAAAVGGGKVAAVDVRTGDAAEADAGGLLGGGGGGGGALALRSVPGPAGAGVGAAAVLQSASGACAVLRVSRGAGGDGPLAVAAVTRRDDCARTAFGVALSQAGWAPELRATALFVATAGAGREALALEALALDSGDSLAAGALAGVTAAGNGAPVALLPALYVRKGAGTLGLRALLSTRDDSVTLAQLGKSSDKGGAKAAWTLTEGLAAPTRIAFADDGSAAAGGGGGGPLPGFLERLALQAQGVAQIAAALGGAAQQLVAVAGSLAAGKGVGGPRGADGGDSLQFGKLVLVMTRSGKLFALGGSDGRVLWSRLFASGGAALFVTRASAAPGVPAELLVVDKEDTAAGAHGTAVWLDAATGTERERAPLPQGADRLVLLPPVGDGAPGAAEARRVLLVTRSGTSAVSTLPAIPAAALEALAPAFTFHAVQRGDAAGGHASLSGHAIEGVDAGTLTQTELWRVAFGAGERVAAVAPRAEGEAVHSPVRIRGDDSLLLKYLNPHTVAIATAKAADPATQAPARVTLHLVDTVAGRTLHRVAHEHATAPVHVVQSENWVIYSYWNGKAKRTEMGSLVLYDGIVEKNGLSPWNRPEVPPTFSSHAPSHPIVLHKTFASMTLRGITSKHVLVALASDQLYALDRRFVDPRRPERKPTPADQMEGLMQFDAQLPMIPSNILTYNKTVARLEHIAASPAAFESISLVVAAGLDMFFVRATPSGSFDLLASDFNHPLLMLLILGLVSATFLASQSAASKTLRTNWA